MGNKDLQILSKSKLSFHEMWNSYNLSDVILCCDQREFRVHRFLLAACSPYLRSIFQSSKNPKIAIDKIASADLERVLFYMYHGSIDMATADLQNFCELLEMFEMSLPADIVVSSNVSDSGFDAATESNYQVFLFPEITFE